MSDTPPYLPDIEDLPPAQPDHEADAAELDALDADDQADGTNDPEED